MQDLSQWSSNLNVHQNQLESLLKQVAGVSDLAGLGWAQEFAFLRVVDVENKLMVMGGGEGEGIKKIGIDTYTLLCLK